MKAVAAFAINSCYQKQLSQRVHCAVRTLKLHPLLMKNKLLLIKVLAKNTSKKSNWGVFVT